MQVLILSSFVLHILCSLMTFGFMMWLLKRESEQPESPIKRRRAGEEDTEQQQQLQRQLLKDEVQYRNEWFERYMYLVLVLLYHIGFDIYLIVRTSQLQSTGDFFGDEGPSFSILVLYILSYTFRMQPQFMAVPNFVYELFLKKMSTRARRHATVIIWERHSKEMDGLERVFHSLLMALFEIPMTLVSLWNTALFFFTSQTCSSYVYCIFSWDHWFQTMASVSIACYMIRNQLVSECASLVTLRSVLGIALVEFLIPFLFWKHLATITILSTVWYEITSLWIGLYLLSVHYQLEDGYI
jgi:hypothetical protein